MLVPQRDTKMKGQKEASSEQPLLVASQNHTPTEEETKSQAKRKPSHRVMLQAKTTKQKHILSSKTDLIKKFDLIYSKIPLKSVLK